MRQVGREQCRRGAWEPRTLRGVAGCRIANATTASCALGLLGAALSAPLAAKAEYRLGHLMTCPVVACEAEAGCAVPDTVTSVKLLLVAGITDVGRQGEFWIGWGDGAHVVLEPTQSPGAPVPGGSICA